MSSLAMSAALIDDNYELPKRSIQHNKTQKRVPTRDVDTNKLNNLMQTLHNSPVEDESDDEMGNFSPPAPPQSAGVEKTIDAKESPAMEYLRQGDEKRAERTSENARGYRDESLDLNNFEKNYENDAAREDYYKKFIPNYPQQAPAPQGSINKPYYTYPSPNVSIQQPVVSSDVLLEKLNYMIHLLEEQQDERVGSVTEEVILYSFLGIFVIFLVDSFTRIGKYTR